MIAITSDAGLTLQLTPGQNLLTELASSWLSDDELPAEISYPLDCPLNDNNRRFVEFGYRPDRAVPQFVMPVTVKMDGVLYRRCTFAYRLQGGKLNGYLKIDSAEFYDKIRKLTLLEALPDVIRLGNGLTDGNNTSLAVRMKAIANLAPGQFPLTFFPIRNEIFIDDAFNDTFLPGYVRRTYVNTWENGNFKTDGTATGGGYLVVPQLYLWYVLERIMSLAGYRIESDWLATDEAQRLVVFNQTAMAVSGLGQNPTTGAADILKGHTIVAGMHLPDMSVSDFLKAIKGRYSLNFDFSANDKVCTITCFADTVAAGPAIDLTPYQVGPYDTDQPAQTGYVVKEYLDDSDELNRDFENKALVPVSYTIGLGGQEISLKVGTCQLINDLMLGSTSQYWIVPTVRQPGNVLDKLYKEAPNYLDKEGKRRNGIGLKLLSYRGITASKSGSSYPLASPDVRNGLQEVVGTQALTFSGRNGAWRKYLRAYYYFRDNTQTISQPLLMPVAVLASLKKFRTVRLSLEDQIGRSYLIKKIQAEQPGPSGRCTVKLDVLSLPSGIELAPDTDDPIVWVELLLGAKVQGSLRNPDKQIDGFYEKEPLQVKIWANASRSAPAIVTNLTVVVRIQKTYFSQSSDRPVAVPYQEYTLSYLVNGSSATIDPDFLTLNNFQSPTVSDYYQQVPRLDPGDGYNILK